MTVLGPAAATPVLRFAPFTMLELEVLRPGTGSYRPVLLAARAELTDEIDAEYERRAGEAEHAAA